MRVVITGAFGSVGVWVVQRLLDEGHEPVAIDTRETYVNRPSLEGSVPFFNTDILDTEALAKLLNDERIDCICHVAAKVSAPNIEAEDDPYSGFMINAMGTVSVLEAARRAGVERVVCASSKAVYGPFNNDYGHPTYRLVTEDLPTRAAPYSRSYDASKMFGEEAGQYYRDRYGLSFRNGRFGTLIRAGKKDLGGSWAAPYSAVVQAALRGEPFAHKVVAGAKDDVTYVKDVAHGLVLACYAEKVESWAFNIATGVGTTWEEWAEAVRTVFTSADIQLEVVPEPWEGFRSQSILSIERARRELGYEPEFDNVAMVRDLAEQYHELKLVD